MNIKTLLLDTETCQEYLALKKGEIEVAFKEASASGKPFLQAAGHAPNGGAFIKVTQFSPVKKAKTNRLQKTEAIIMKSTLMNVDEELVADLELGHVFEGETLVTVQTLDRTSGFPVGQRNGQYAHIAGQPVYESLELLPEGTPDTALENVEYIGENASKRENAETIIFRGVQRKTGFPEKITEVANPFAALHN